MISIKTLIETNELNPAQQRLTHLSPTAYYTIRALAELQDILAGTLNIEGSVDVSQAADAREEQIKTLADTFDATAIASHAFPTGTRGFRIKNTGAAALRFAVDEAPETGAWDGTFKVGQEIAADESSEFRLIESTAEDIHLWGTDGETYIIEVF